MSGKRAPARRLIWGIDYDTFTITVAELDLDDPSYCHSFIVGKRGTPKGGRGEAKRADERLYDLRDGFVRLVRSRRATGLPVYAYIEEPVAVPGGVLTTIRQSAVWGACRIILRDEGVPCLTVNVSTWKKEALLNGHATKENVRDWAVAVYRLPTDLAQDVYDAVAIAAAARKTMGGQHPT